MAFLSKVGNILRQTTSKQVSSELSASKSFLYQAIRCMSTSKLFIGGLSYSTDQQGLKEAFAKYGEVVEARVILDRESGRSRGFGFVTYTTNEEASSAIQALDGQDLHGRRIRVDYATDRQPRFSSGYGGSPGSYSGGGGYGGGGSYGGGGGYGGGGYGGNEGGGYGGGGNYGTRGDMYGSGGNYTVAGGGGGGSGSSDGFFDTDDSIGGGNSFPGAAPDLGTNQSESLENGAGGFDQDAPLEGNYKDDDAPEDDFAKRA